MANMVEAEASILASILDTNQGLEDAAVASSNVAEDAASVVVEMDMEVAAALVTMVLATTLATPEPGVAAKLSVVAMVVGEDAVDGTMADILINSQWCRRQTTWVEVLRTSN